MIETLGWVAAGLGMAAGLLVAGDWGRHRTGTGFVLFSVMSALWMAIGWMEGQSPLIVQNLIMLAINLFGVWRYLLSPREKRVIDKLNQIAPEVEAEVKQDMKEEKSA